ncbi:hypothetical protein, partial [Duncaniella sp.]|uniref:hypothetical protein n=1 Tax=Duncaniella sp. TaxID=2518496 RepID=UPI0023BB6372
PVTPTRKARRCHGFAIPPHVVSGRTPIYHSGWYAAALSHYFEGRMSYLCSTFFPDMDFNNRLFTLISTLPFTDSPLDLF